MNVWACFSFHGDWSPTQDFLKYSKRATTELHSSTLEKKTQIHTGNNHFGRQPLYKSCVKATGFGAVFQHSLLCIRWLLMTVDVSGKAFFRLRNTFLYGMINLSWESSSLLPNPSPQLYLLCSKPRLAFERLRARETHADNCPPGGGVRTTNAHASVPCSQQCFQRCSN